jgi:hypothetical protein
MTRVGIFITHPDGTETNHELGEFQEVWKAGVAIGSDPACTVVLPDLPRVAVFVWAMSNHKVMLNLPPDAPLPFVRPSNRYDARVDHRPFSVGNYTIRFAEV